MDIDNILAKSTKNGGYYINTTFIECWLYM